MLKLLANWLKRPIKGALPVVTDTVTESVTEASVPSDRFDRNDVGLPEMVPYDEHLLERSRTQWQFGDWGTLAKLERDVLQHHPDRAKLALLAAAGHQQLGNVTATRKFVCLAQDWGCSKKLISQILIAGVHNTLGRAAAMEGNQNSARSHFEKAIATASPGTDARLLIQARARGELERLDLPVLNDRLPSHQGNTLPLFALGLNQSMRHLAEQVQKNNAELVEHIKKQNAEFVSIRKQLETTMKKEMLNATQQLEAFLGIQSFLNNGERIPSLHGWPISPDFALYLIELIDSNDYDLIIEFGSGTSTVLIAKTLARMAAKQKTELTATQVAFEHLEEYHTQTLSLLKQAKLSEKVQLILAPLQPYAAPNGVTYQYYNFRNELEAISKNATSSRLNILVMVDGPPAATGKHARYPAAPAVLAQFKDAHIDILLDDYNRNDEKEIVQLWLQYINDLGISSTMSTRSMEKDACLLRIENTTQHKPSIS